MTARSDTDPGRLLRPFTLTSGSVDGAAPVLDLASMVVAVDAPGEEYETAPEQAEILRLCVTPHSIAEIAAALDFPPSLTRLLVSEMVEAGSLCLGAAPDPRPTGSVLQAVLEGLRSL